MEKQEIAQLVEKSRQGDNDAFSKLYQLTEKQAYFIALRIAKNEDDAFDILHDCYIKAMQKMDTLENPENFVAWFNQIVSNTSKNYVVKSKPMLFRDDEDEAAVMDFQADDSLDVKPDDSLDTDETRAFIRELVDELPEDKRMCVLMFYFQNMGTAQIAEALGISEGTVKTRLYHSRDKIKQSIEALEKKGIKVRGIAPIPFFVWMLKRMAENTQVSESAATAVIKAATSSAAAGATAATGTATAASTAAATVETTTGAAVTTGITAKVVAIAIAGVITVGGVVAGIKVKNEKSNETTISISTAVSSDSRYDASPIEWFEYEIENDEAIIVSCTSEAEGMVVIPDEIDGYPVTKIKERCFWDSSEVTELYIPASVNEIDSIIFSFHENGSKIERIIVSKNNADFYSDEYGVLYNKEKTTLLFYPYNSKHTHYVVPDGVTGFSVNAFYYNQKIETVELPDSIESFPNSLFAQCFNLKYVNIPSKLETIPSSAFANCIGLQYIAIPSSVKTIEEYSFTGCDNLEFIHFNSFSNNIDVDFCQGENILICSSSSAVVQKMQTVHNISCVLCEHSEEDLTYVPSVTNNNSTEHRPQSTIRVMATMPPPTKNHTERNTTRVSFTTAATQSSNESDGAIEGGSGSSVTGQTATTEKNTTVYTTVAPITVGTAKVVIDVYNASLQKIKTIDNIRVNAGTYITDEIIISEVLKYKSEYGDNYTQYITINGGEAISSALSAQVGKTYSYVVVVS